jgi:hypothetical protein
MPVIPPGFLEGLGAAACLGTSDFVSRTNSRRIGSFAAASMALTLGTIPFLLFWPFPDFTSLDPAYPLFCLGGRAVEPCGPLACLQGARPRPHRGGVTHHHRQPSPGGVGEWFYGV